MTDKVLATVEVASAWASKINWTAAIGGIASLITLFSGGQLGLDASTQATLVGMIALLQSGVTILLRTKYTTTVTPNSVNSTPPNVLPVVVKILLVAFMLSAFLAGDSAHAAQLKKPALTGDPIADIKTDLANAGIKTPAVAPGAACDFNIFAALDPQNVVTMIQNCVSDANKPFLPDVQAALDSATAYKDKPAIDCLTPALAIVQAAVGTPAVIAADGTVTTPAKMAGVILIFQKFREFTLANGPAACKNWVQSTINGTVAGTL
jgi:hypothetical protein